MVKSVEEVVESGEESGGGWICRGCGWIARGVVESVEEMVKSLEV